MGAGEYASQRALEGLQRAGEEARLSMSARRGIGAAGLRELPETQAAVYPGAEFAPSLAEYNAQEAPTLVQAEELNRVLQGLRERMVAGR